MNKKVSISLPSDLVAFVHTHKLNLSKIVQEKLYELMLQPSDDMLKAWQEKNNAMLDAWKEFVKVWQEQTISNAIDQIKPDPKQITHLNKQIKHEKTQLSE